MNKAIKVRPLNNRRVMDPQTQRPVPAEGAKVMLSSYWQRREKAGEVEILPVEGEK